MLYFLSTFTAEEIPKENYLDRRLPFFTSENINYQLNKRSFTSRFSGLNIFRHIFANEHTHKNSFKDNCLADKSKYLILEKTIEKSVLLMMLRLAISITLYITAYNVSEDMFGIPTSLGVGIVMLWNILQCNLLSLYYFTFSSKDPKLVYLDRQNQTINFTTKKKCSPPLTDEFGNPAFPIEGFTLNVKQESTRRAYTLLIHKNVEQHNTVPWICLEPDPSNGDIEAAIEQWARYLRYLDLTLPLPDSPNLELYRRNDPRTKEFDLKNNRPDGFWIQFDYNQQEDIKNEILNNTYYEKQFKLSKEQLDIYDIVAPWLQFTPKQEENNNATKPKKASNNKSISKKTLITEFFLFNTLVIIRQLIYGS